MIFLRKAAEKRQKSGDLKYQTKIKGQQAQ